jgi:hypothetical protein
MIDMIDISERHSAYAPFFVLRVLMAGYVPSKVCVKRRGITSYRWICAGKDELFPPIKDARRQVFCVNRPILGSFDSILIQNLAPEDLPRSEERMRHVPNN